MAQGRKTETRDDHPPHWIEYECFFASHMVCFTDCIQQNLSTDWVHGHVLRQQSWLSDWFRYHILWFDCWPGDPMAFTIPCKWTSDLAKVVLEMPVESSKATKDADPCELRSLFQEFEESNIVDASLYQHSVERPGADQSDDAGWVWKNEIDTKKSWRNQMKSNFVSSAGFTYNCFDIHFHHGRNYFQWMPHNVWYLYYSI